MPLTPAEVHNVAFKKPPIGKRGYDEEEVDAFLDIVEVELSRLIEENNELRSGRPAADGAAQQPTPAARSGIDPAELEAARADNGRLQQRVSELEAALDNGQDGAQQQVVSLQQQLAQTQQHLSQTEAQLNENRSHLEEAQRAAAQAQQESQAAKAQAAQAAQAPQNAEAVAAAPASAPQHLQAVQMLALAQQTADQHLAQSKAEADRLVTEAQSHVQSLVNDANDRTTRQLAEADDRSKKLNEESTARAAQTVNDAEQRAQTITAQFEQRKAALERRVEELRTFEREYRTRLKSYLESQLRDLDASSKADPAAQNSQPQNSEYADQQA